MPAIKNTMTPDEASKYLAEREISLTAQAIREGLIQQRLPFGIAIMIDKNYIYRISARQLTEWADKWIYNEAS